MSPNSCCRGLARLALQSKNKMLPQDIFCALDWTINTNHTGFYVAQHLNHYTEEALSVSFVEPGADVYTPPAEKVREGTAMFAVTPSETVISSHSQSTTPALQVWAMPCALSAWCKHTRPTL